MKRRLALLFIPFLCTAVALTGLYTLLHYMLLVRFETLPVKEIWVEVLLPSILAALIGIFYFRKRIVLLRLGWRGHDFYTFICIIGLAVPSVVAQMHLEESFGKLTRVERPSQIDLRHPTRYYHIDRAWVANNRGGYSMKTTSANRYGSKIMVTFFFAAPMFDSPSDSLSPRSNRWIVNTYSSEFPNTALDKSEQQARIEEYFRRCAGMFTRHRFDTRYLRNSRGSDDHDYCLEAVNDARIGAAEPLLILLPKKGSYQARTGNGYNWIWYTFLGGIALWFILMVNTPFDRKMARRFFSNHLRAKDRERRRQSSLEMLAMFYPQKKIWAAPVIFDINLLLFLAMAIGGVSIFTPRSADLLAWGGCYAPAIARGEWWRLLTSMFLHAGVLHLAMNMLVFYMICLPLEEALGSRRFMIIYLVSGLAAGVCSLCLHHTAAVSVGASGAIFGMYGLTAAMMLTGYVDRTTVSTFRPMIFIFIFFNIFTGLLNGNIDMAAHVGGLGAGFIIGLLFFPKYKKHKR
ncbi:rhomboid family intramembrane serine protease [Bacteroidia bacterium]|nr:rhomboid family intramembrane serine protease [Bacteroidia bacterium]